MAENPLVRQAQPQDCAAILALMRELARFEGYENEFRVTEGALCKGLFEQQNFYVLVATFEDAVVGILTYYFLPFTYDLSPWIYIKELYVDAAYRSRGIGKKMMEELMCICREAGGTKIRWNVLSNNHQAKKFYLSLGASCEFQWEIFNMDRNRLY